MSFSRFGVGACALLVAATAPAAAQEQVFRAERGPYRAVNVVTGVEQPWAVAFLSTGEMLVTERAGRLRVVRNGALVPEPVAGVPRVRFEGQGGLLDVVPHPGYASNRLVYLSFSKPNAEGTQSTTAVIRGRFDGARLTDVQEILEAKAWSAGGGHYGSRLAFDRDGYLFVTVGDRQVQPNTASLTTHPAQDLGTHNGKILRLHDDGRVPADNPFVGRAGALPEIWSYGHRNLQGLTFHPETGDLWSTEHGPQGGDELNRIQPGRNYGWPVVGYGVNYGGAVIHTGGDHGEFEAPVQHFTPSIGPSGLIVYDGARYPEWRGSAFVGGLSGFQLARLPLVQDSRVVGRLERPALILGLGRVRDVRQGPDGFIYVAIEDRPETGASRIVRLEPAQ